MTEGRGGDALLALLELFSVLTALGRRLPAGSRIQGIVTDGGRATNIIPEYAEGLFGRRAATSEAREGPTGQLRACAEGVAHATGTGVEVERATLRYGHFRDSGPLPERFAEHLSEAGIEPTPPAPGVYLGSSDIGNVSTRVPAIHPFVAIMDDGSDHTPEFATAAASPGPARYSSPSPTRWPARPRTCSSTRTCARGRGHCTRRRDAERCRARPSPVPGCGVRARPLPARAA
ncbi:hypothetical protein ACF07S_17555 [Streptomyces sp. NPDC016640]|uniref:hypothetical protein n=1 Tax=Streptomyces sp. NPDC016640 TaxID=3364969 RepID=UPI0036F5F2EF